MSAPASAYDDLIAALDGTGLGLSDIISITGFYLTDSQVTGYRRLYLDEGQLSWIDVMDSDILHSRRYAEDIMPLGLTTIWVRHTAEIQISQKTDAEGVTAEFLNSVWRGGDTAPGWCRDQEGFVKPGRSTRLSGRGGCYTPYSGRGGC